MKTNLKNYAILALFMALFFVSCNHEDNLSGEDSLPKTEETTPEGMMVLGEQLENPYSLGNMNLAMRKLSSTVSVELKATHLYVRFLPQSEEEMTVLTSDTTLDLYSYPLDYEIKQAGDYYHDPSLPSEEITWQYTVVKPNYKFPSIKYEILSELFILDEDDEEEELTTRSYKYQNIDWEALEDKALEITGNLEEDADEARALRDRRSKWRPSGRITMYEDSKKENIPLVGAMVRARRWFTTHKGYTNSAGYFSCDGRFRRKANYSIKWERHYWDIRSGTWGQAIYNGPKQKGSWNLNITGGNSLRYAFIHQAAYDYFYRNPFFTQRPFDRKRYRSTLKIGYYDKYGESLGDFAKWRNWFTFPHIRVYKGAKGAKKDRTTTQIYATTIHELAHSAHWQLIVNAKGSNRVSDFINADKKLKDSWAVGMQTIFTRHFIYRNYDRYGNRYTYTRDTDYSEIALELMEKAKYTPRELELSLVDANSLGKWKTNIKNKYKKDEKTLDTIFSRY